jgi:O-antigen/teichoic acid export membrane protein
VTEARALPTGLPVPGRRPFMASTIGLVAGKGLQMGGGFLFWVIAARAASPVELGLVAAVVSAVLLCTQLGQMGTGAGVIVSLGTGGNRTAVLDTAFTVVLLAGAAVAGGALLVAAIAGGDFAAVTGTVGFAALFVLSVVTGTMMICLDQVNVALGRGGNSSVRYAAAGVVTVAATAALVLSPVASDSRALFACWSLGAVAACSVGVVQLRSLAGYSYRPRLHAGHRQQLLVVGVPNQVLTMIERAPGLVVPIAVAHTVSLEATAYWYPAWMMAWVAYSAPVLVGLVQFAEGVKDPGRLARSTRTGLGWSLFVGAGISVVMVVLAHPLLHLMGARYAEASTGALRLLAIGLVPYAVIQSYNSVCRVRSRLREAIAVNAVLGVALCTVTVSVAKAGPTAMAAGWLTCLSAGAVVAGVRAVRLVRGVTQDD